jgi:hypothetical protein
VNRAFVIEATQSAVAEAAKRNDVSDFIAITFCASIVSQFIAAAQGMPRLVAKEDFPLVGGRLDVVGQMPVPRFCHSHPANR